MATRRPTPPRRSTRRPSVTNTRRDLSPRVTSRVQQQTTGRGRIVQPLPGRWGMPVPGRYPSSTTSTGAAAAPAPAVPAAPAAPQYNVSNLPPDASYDAQIAALQRQRDDQIAALVQQRSSGLLDYGFTEGPSGALAFDPNNPYSKAALLKKTYDTNRRSTGNSMAAGGQLYSGAYQNAQDLISRNQLQSEDSLQRALIGFLAQNTQRRTAAGTNFETAAMQAYGDRVGRFQSNPLYDPASGALSASAGTGGASTPAPAAAPAAAPRASSVAAALRRRARATGLRLGRI